MVMMGLITFLICRVDLPVSKEDYNVRDEDTPKGFSRLFRFKEMQIKRQQEKKERKLANPVRLNDFSFFF